MMTTMTDQQAADAIRAHHGQMAVALRGLVADLEAAVRTQRDHRAAHDGLLAYLRDELLPHAIAEEGTLYRAADAGPAAMLVQAMRDEHVDLIEKVDAFDGVTDALEALALARVILALFYSHLHKENDLLVPALQADASVSLAELLGGMHELLG